jgi:hypothetical protein
MKYFEEGLLRKFWTQGKGNTRREEKMTFRGTLFSLKNIVKVIKSRRMSWTGHVARRGMSDAHKILLGKPEEKGSFVRPGYRWESNIKMYPKEIVCDHVDWIHVAQDRDQWRGLVNTVMNFRVQ